MKTRNILLLLLSVLMMGTVQTASAWTGSTPAAIRTASGDEKAFYLYNVSTGKFLTLGGVWGTQAVMSDAGMQFSGLTRYGSSGSKYYINTSVGDGYMILSTGKNTKDTYYYFVDQGTVDIYTFTISAVAGETNVYTILGSISSDVTTNSSGQTITTGIKAGSYYMSVDEDGKCHAVKTMDETCKWMFVTLAEIKDNFNNTDGTADNPAPALHLTRDAGFYRNDNAVNNWRLGSVVQKQADNYKYYTVTSSGSGNTITENSVPDTGIKPADAIPTTTTTEIITTPAEYVYTVNCLSQSGLTDHTFTVNSSVPIAGLENVGDHTTLTKNKEFIACNGVHIGNPKSQDITLTSYTPEVTREVTTTTGGYVYHIGNGYSMAKATGTHVFEDGETYENTYYQDPFGGNWTANIHGADGSIFQTVTIEREGWWKVSAKGFTNDGSGHLFAYTSASEQTTDTYQTQAFATPSADVMSTLDTYVKASKYLNTTEAQGVIVYVNEGETITFGAFIDDEHDGTVGTNTSWTCFDDVVLSYLGKGNLNLIIDEENTDLANINAQVYTAKNQTLRLTRNFLVDQWNSFVLPVNLTAQQVKTAFGADTKLSALSSTDNGGKRIYFEKVDLSKDNEVVVRAGNVYVMKPQNVMPTKQRVVKHASEPGISGRDIETRITGDGLSSYYTINQVSLTTALTSSTVKNNPVESGEDSGIRMAGSYVYLNPDGTEPNRAIPANSYILGVNEGVCQWYYHTTGVKKVKGLRGWIETGVNGTTSTNSIKVFINGVNETEVTAIDGLVTEPLQMQHADNNVYNIQGQIVRRNSTSTVGLAKGLYIIGGRKVVVR